MFKYSTLVLYLSSPPFVLSDVNNSFGATIGLHSALQDYIPGRAVCSAARKLICECRTKTATGARAFAVVAPKVWHDLPGSIRSIKSITSFKI